MPHAVRMTKGPSTSVLTETEEEASHDETSTHEESEAEQEASINHPHKCERIHDQFILILMPHIQSTLICICHTSKV